MWSFGTPYTSTITNVSSLPGNKLTGNWIPLMSCANRDEQENLAKQKTASLLDPNQVAYPPKTKALYQL